jgi:phosphotransferase system enzyme I (PtsI)
MSCESHCLYGAGVSPGISIGNICIIRHHHIEFERYHLTSQHIRAEIGRFHHALYLAGQHLKHIIMQFATKGIEQKTILEAHQILLEDPIFIQEVEKNISEKKMNAEWSVHHTVERLQHLWMQFENHYLRERQSDIDCMRDRLLSLLTGQSEKRKYWDLEIEKGTPVIAVSSSFSPIETALFLHKKVAAIVTANGGQTSHASILARSLAIPAIIGVQDICEIATHGAMAIVDGASGCFMMNPTPWQMTEAHRQCHRFYQLRTDLLKSEAVSNSTQDTDTIAVYGNIEQVHEVESVLSAGGDGIGLYRTEFLFFSAYHRLSANTHYEAYRQLLLQLAGQPCIIRTLDLGSDKSFGDTNIKHQESNPALGIRGIRFSLKEQRLFDEQIEGLLRAAIYGDLRIMLPMVSCIEELRLAKTKIELVAQRLRQHNIPHQSAIPIGIMIEVPSTIFILDLLAEECDFMSIGSNDLLQYFLAVDRNNGQLCELYNAFHPAMLRLLNSIANNTQNYKCPISICGEIAGDIFMLPFLVGLGIQKLSMSAHHIPLVKRLIRRLHREDCLKLIPTVLSCKTSEETRHHMHLFAKEHFSDIVSMVNGVDFSSDAKLCHL